MKKVLFSTLVFVLFISFSCDVGSDSKNYPTVLSTLPDNSAIDVSTLSKITIHFSEEMNEIETQTAFTISPDPGGDKIFSWDDNSMTVEFENELISHTFYSCNISRAAKNAKDRKMKKEYQWDFVTQQTSGITEAADIRLDSTPMGSVWYFNEIAANGNNVYYTWADSRNGNYEVFVNYSKDGGKTWLPNEIKVSTNPGGVISSSRPKIRCSGEKVYVIWTDDRNGLTDICMNYSHDGGKTWLPTDFRVNKDGAGTSVTSSGAIACSGDHVYIAWYDDRNGVMTDIYFNYSDDGGVTWQPSDKRINTNAIGQSSASDVRLCATGKHVYIEFLDVRSGGQSDIYFNCSHDYGVTWLESDFRIDTDSPGANQNWRPNMACDGKNVLVAWTDYRNGDRDIYANFSNDYGETWQSNDIRLDSDTTNADAWWPYLDVCGDSFYVVWNDGRNGQDDIYFNCSHDAGATWLNSDMRIEHDAGPGQFKTFRCKVLASGKSVFAVWEDNRNGWNDIFINFSTDGGMTWQASDFRLDKDTPGSAGSQRPQMAISGGNVYVGWMDDRNGTCLYFNTLK